MAIEETMSSLAHSQVTQSIPSVADDIQGFQLIDSDEEKNSAIGVLVVLIGDTCDYIPVIYRKGKIHKMDIMYIPELDQWLPTQDNWITYLRSHKTDLLATLKNKDQRFGKKPGSVDLNLPFRNIVKVASGENAKQLLARVGVPAMLKEASDAMVYFLTADPQKIELPSAIELLNKCASDTTAGVINAIAKYPTVNNAFAQFYTDDDILSVAENLATRAAITDREQKDIRTAATQGSVKLLTLGSSESKDLDTLTKSKLLRDGAIIVDNRGLTPTKVYKMKDNKDWGTASHFGVYELLKIDGDTLTAYVVPQADNKYVVVPMDDFQGRKAYIMETAPLGQLYPFDDIPIPTSLSFGTAFNKSSENSFERRVIFTTRGDSVIVDNAPGSYVGTEDSSVFVPKHSIYISLPGGYHADISRIEQLPKGARVRVSGNTVYVPEDAKIIPVADYEDGNLPLATFEELQDATARRSKLLKIKIYNGDDKFTISNISGEAKSDLSKTAAAYTLVKDYAVAPDQAANMIKEASASRNSSTRYLLKVADTSAVSLAFSENPDQEHTRDTVSLDSQLPEEMRQQLEIAGNSGIKEVMDVTVLKSLAADAGSVRQIQDYLPKLFSAMDAVARLLFMLRASDAMGDAYGEGRVGEMESQFARLLESLGDAIICLQQGRIDDVNDLLEGPLAESLG